METGQAGQPLRCICGQEVEAPSIRHLRELESVADQEIPSPTWTVRQGLVFLGTAILGLAILAAGAIVVLRPAAANRKSFMLNIDKATIQREVSTLSPAQAYARLESVMFLLPGYAEQLAQGAVPPHLLPCLGLLAKLEGKGPEPLAPLASLELAKQAGKLRAEIADQQENRRAMDDWLWVIAAAALVGIFMACAALIFPQRKPRRRATAGSRR